MVLILAGVGIHGVMAQAIGSRKEELGIRAAFKVASRAIGSSVFRQGGVTTVLGLLAWAAWVPAVIKMVESRLWGVAPA